MAADAGAEFGRIDLEAPIARQVCRLLRARIIRNDLAPGRKISESEIAAEYGISRQPVREAFIRLAAEGLIVRGGGHAMAAGLTVEAAGIPAAMARLSELVAGSMQGQETGALRISGLLDARAASFEMIEALDRAGPFGAGAPAPRFALSDQILEQVQTMGEGHLRLRARSPGAPTVKDAP